MFLLELTFTADLVGIDAAMKAHMRWLHARTCRLSEKTLVWSDSII